MHRCCVLPISSLDTKRSSYLQHACVRALYRWVHCLEEEFFRQGDQEKAAGLPISPLFDRDKPGVTKSQTGFFDVVVFPLFQVRALCQPLSSSLQWYACLCSIALWKMGVYQLGTPLFSLGQLHWDTMLIIVLPSGGWSDLHVHYTNSVWSWWVHM